jgi:CRISPR/Cas system CSM-associated protein Csm3 (group 7 of RAMP superfamily)
MSRGLVDRTTRRNARGEVYVPASTIKGRLRNACEDVARLYCSADEQLQRCRPPSPQNMCRGSAPCIVCRIFGSAYVGERLFFDDAVLRDDLREVYDPAIQSEPRTRVKLDRRRGAAAKGHLFSTEYAEPQLAFRTEVSGRLPLTPLAEEKGLAYELILLAAGVRMVKELGGDKSAGFGACQMSFTSDIRIGNKPEERFEVSPMELIHDWLEWLSEYNKHGEH